MWRFGFLALVAMYAHGLATREDEPPPSKRELVNYSGKDARLTGYRVPFGVKVEIVASEPTIVNPVGLTFLDDGTPLLLERRQGKAIVESQKVKFPDGTVKLVQRWKRSEKDQIKALAASSENGVWDRARVVFEAPWISSMQTIEGRLYFAGNGEISRVSLPKEGEPPAPIERLLHGVIHQPDSVRLRLGPDGWLYLSDSGIAHRWYGADGSSTTWLGGSTLVRCRPDGSQLRLYARGQNALSASAFDAEGRVYLIAGEPRRGVLLHVSDEAYLPGLTGISLSQGDLTDPLGYQGVHFPEEFRNSVLVADPIRRRIQVYRFVPSGSTVELEEQFTLLSAAADPPFTPTQLLTGPDGAIYVVDRRKGIAQGRVLRLSMDGQTLFPLDRWKNLSTRKEEELVRLCASEDGEEREQARRELVRRGSKIRPALLHLLQQEDSSIVARLTALRALTSMLDADVQAALIQALEEQEPPVARLVAEALGLHAKPQDRSVSAALVKALANEDRAVRRTVALALARLGGAGAAENLTAALAFDRSEDAVYRQGLSRGLELLGKSGMDALLTMANSGVQKDSDRVVEVFLSFRSAAALEAIPKLLLNPHLSETQRVALIRSTREYRLDPPASLDPLVSYVLGLEKASEDLTQAMLDALAILKISHGEKAEQLARSVVMSKEASDELKTAAIPVLARSSRGAKLLGEQFLAGKIPAGLRREVEQALRPYVATDDQVKHYLEQIQK